MMMVFLFSSTSVRTGCLPLSVSVEYAMRSRLEEVEFPLHVLVSKKTLAERLGLDRKNGNVRVPYRPLCNTPHHNVTEPGSSMGRYDNQVHPLLLRKFSDL